MPNLLYGTALLELARAENDVFGEQVKDKELSSGKQLESHISLFCLDEENGEEDGEEEEKEENKSHSEDEDSSGDEAKEELKETRHNEQSAEATEQVNIRSS